MGGQAGQVTFSSVMEITIGGNKLSDEVGRLLVEGSVDQGIGVPAAFQLTFQDPRREVFDLLKVEFGSEVVIAPVAGGKGAADPLLTGEVTALEAEFDKGAGSSAVIRGYDSGFRLMRQRRVVAYKNQTAASIVRKLAVQDGVPIGQIDPTGSPYEFISQSGVTDWDFLARLADDCEMDMSIDARGKLQFVKGKKASGAPSPTSQSDTNPALLRGGDDILRLQASVTAADQVKKVESRGWNVTTKKAITATKTIAANDGISIGSTSREATKKLKPATLVETRTPYDKDKEVQQAAKAFADDVTSSFAELEIVVRGKPKLRAGIPVALSNVGKPFEGKYTVTSVRHVFGNGDHYESWVTVSGRQWRSLYGLTSGGGGAADTEARLPSVANALVTDVRDPLKQGRVKLEFPWLDDRYVSDWARVVQWGGKRGGGIFPMDVGDEVLVGFDRGALDHPFVIGGLYNGRDDPTPVTEPLYSGMRRRAARHTLSDRTGNRLDLLSPTSGRAGTKGVRLATGNDQLKIFLDRTNTEITVDSKGTVSITGGRSVSVEAGTDLNLSARRKLTLDGQFLELRSRGYISLRSLAGPISMNAAGPFSVNSVGAFSANVGGVMSLTAPTISLKGITTVVPPKINNTPVI
ncbi:VgrG-related protein [Streptomyces sp. 6N223]|uniref:VgrG-related protein n=1 Tax=Streptomyces sp. 6N223 TaxID=3457412 RepID=UPI003FD42C0C